MSSVPANRRWPRLPANNVTWLLMVFVSCAVVLFAMLYWMMHTYLLHEVDERLRGEVAEFSSIGRAEAIANIAALSRRDIASSRPYGVFDEEGRWLAGNIHALPAERERRPFYYTQAMNDGPPSLASHFRGIIVPTRSGLRVVVGHSIDEIIHFDHTLVKILCLGLMLTILLAVGCGAALHAMSNRRIRSMSLTAREIMAGQLSRRLSNRGTHHDLDRLAEIVNLMLDEIERLVAEVRGVCAGIAHDLRTPMTHLRAGLERTRRRSHTVDDYTSAVDTAIAQSDVVLNRFTALLRIAEVEADVRRASFCDVSLDTILRDVAELYEPVAENRRLSVAVLASEPVFARGDVDLLFGAIENLLDNALKFTPGGGAVTLQATLEAGRPVVQVADTGPGIEAGERDAVLRPFYRSRNGQEAATSGHGVGLSLVAAIARVHEAVVEIHDNTPGCRIVLRFNAGLPAR
ncbi:sensor histidine kinase [Paraburkholderia sp. UCT31]|uniref:sensor histidine kinase n=1 Tax=Paraburkholderia sp. UCT31 TaxID=2615209 RepID=UPI001655ED49|nr:HAMP domain-containing sensor histidine kinase [Paraburkholderia sp. UCT31]